MQQTQNFFIEEITANRANRGEIAKISGRMLETLETIALGAKLDRLPQFNKGEVDNVIEHETGNGVK